MQLQLVTPATVTPFTLDEVKEHVRQLSNDDDFYLQTLIDAVISQAENITRRALYTSTWRLYLDCFTTREILLPRAPLQSVTHLKYYDTAGTQQTLDPALYQVDAVGEPARVAPLQNTFWPVTQYGKLNAVEIEFVAGWEKRFDLPASLRQAMLYHISHMYDVREPVVIGTIQAGIPFTIEAMYAPHRVMRFY